MNKLAYYQGYIEKEAFNSAPYSMGTTFKKLYDKSKLVEGGVEEAVRLGTANRGVDYGVSKPTTNAAFTAYDFGKQVFKDPTKGWNKDILKNIKRNADKTMKESLKQSTPRRMWEGYSDNAKPIVAAGVTGARTYSALQDITKNYLDYQNKTGRVMNTGAPISKQEVINANLTRRENTAHKAPISRQAVVNANKARAVRRGE